jgi:hypothetical protein
VSRCDRESASGCIEALEGDYRGITISRGMRRGYLSRAGTRQSRQIEEFDKCRSRVAPAGSMDNRDPTASHEAAVENWATHGIRAEPSHRQPLAEGAKREPELAMIDEERKLSFQWLEWRLWARCRP